MENFSRVNRIFYLPFDNEAIFIERKNKFLGLIEFEGKYLEAHIHDPGRLEKILYKGNKILFQKIEKFNRKTNFEIIFGKYNDNFVLINSKYHNKIAEKILLNGYIDEIKDVKFIKREKKINKNKIDFLVIDKKGEEFFIEVKGCTLEENNIALFPDAPTKRGSKHLKVLCDLLDKNKKCFLIILVFIKEAQYFSPNKYIDENFYNNFINCFRKGLIVYPFKLEYNIYDNYIYLTQKLSLNIF
ncbi:MAG: DNA/RNA nuclease SfsA [Caldisericia bacterium]|nr:DNA/RNA nuclease SfsA [Caldisericia bacterium]